MGEPFGVMGDLGGLFALDQQREPRTEQERGVRDVRDALFLIAPLRPGGGRERTQRGLRPLRRGRGSRCVWCLMPLLHSNT